MDMKKPTPMKSAEPDKASLPALGDVVIYHAPDGDLAVIVTKVHADSFDGQAFLDGTDRQSVVGLSDHWSPKPPHPINLKSKEA